MNKKHIFTLLFSFFISTAFSQIFWTEDFDAPCGDPCFGDGFASPNGNWTITETGFNGADSNIWFVSGQECGLEAGECGIECNGGDASLHIANSFVGDSGASYLAGGGGFFDPLSDVRSESPTIDCSGYADITVSFNYIENGDGVIDNATFWYYDGTDWTEFEDLIKTPTGNCGVQGEWLAYSAVLPVSANNNPNIQLGFRWVNNDDNIGTDPSVAVDDITLSSGSVLAVPVAQFEDPSSPICAGETISFVDQSTTDSALGITDWSWDFGNTEVSSDQNPIDILYDTPGTYDITLIVTDEFGDSDPYTFTLTVNDCTPIAEFTVTPTSICTDGCVSFENTSTSFDDIANVTIDWDFGNSNTTDDEVPADECYDTPGTYTISLTVTDFYGTNTATQEITVADCVPPVPDFTMSEDTICVSDCISFEDLSVGTNISDWSWTFEGADVPDFNGQNPGNICWNTAGTFDITLSITDDVGTESVSMELVVFDNPAVEGIASANELCDGDEVTLTGAGADTYEWTAGVIDGEAFIPSIGMNVYTVTGTDLNGCSATADVMVDVIDCQEPIANFELSSDSICEGECIIVTDLSQNADTYQWNFGTNAIPSTFDGSDPGEICFDDNGIYTFELIVSNLLGSDTLEMDVEVFNLPTVNAFDAEVDLGLEVIISATTSAVNGTYEWTPGNTLEDPNSLVTTAFPEMDTNYIMTVTDENGCVGMDTAFVHVIIIPGVGVPTAFTPNQDGDNDTFGPLGEGYELLAFAVYNRYGQMVFETTDKDMQWDGKFEGVEQNPGVFFWYLRYEWFVGEEAGFVREESGQVTLIK